MKKKILSLVLAISMLMSFMPVVASAASSGTCGDNLTWTLDDDGTLTISGTGEMAEYSEWSYSSTPWYSERLNIKNVVIENGVASIGSCAFYNCSDLTSVTIPDGVTSIGRGAFMNCGSLKNVTIPNSVTEIASEAFYGCSSLTNITIPDSVTEIGDSAFCRCSGLTDITIGRGITTIKNSTFYDCDGLTTVTIPNNITSIGERAFECCDNLINISIPNNVTSINCYAFKDTAYYNDSANWEDGILYIDNYLVRADMSINGEAIIKDGTKYIAVMAFEFCDVLTKITIPDSVSSIDSIAFVYCDSLTDVYYTSTKAMWDKISIGNGNDDLLNATLHCSGIEPTPTPMPTPTPAPTYIPVTEAEVTKTETDSAWSFDVAVEEVYEGSNAYVAVYDSDNNLIGVSSVLVTDTTSVVVEKTDDASYAKVFVWTNGMQPTTLAERVELADE